MTDDELGEYDDVEIEQHTPVKNEYGLMPCPFCGLKDISLGGHIAWCSDYDTTGSSVYPQQDAESAIRIWNIRKEPREIPGWLRKQIEEQMDDYEMALSLEQLFEDQKQYIRAQWEALNWVMSLKKEGRD